MNFGYDKSLYLLRFDHHQPYVSDMVYLEPAIDETPLEQIIVSHQLKHCRRSQCRLMFKVLVPPTASQLARAGGNKDVFDRPARPLPMQPALQALQDAGIEPDVWKVEGLNLHADGERVVQLARRGGREQVGGIARANRGARSSCN